VRDEFLVDLAELARHPRPAPEVGGKARGLAALIAADLPVPRGFVALPAARDRLAEVAERARELTPPLVVRSSATVEDSDDAAAPGIFATVRDVDHDGVAGAAEQVWRSVDDPIASAYAELRDITEPIQMAVVVQEQRTGPARGSLYTRAPGDDGQVLIELDDASAWATADRATGAVIDGALPIDPAELVALAVAAERAIDTARADIEWLFDGHQYWLLQARPVTAPAQRPRPPAALFAELSGDGIVWRWDAAHNPEPLSPAQISLVDHVDRGGLAPYRMRVIGGYLYFGASEPPTGELVDDAASLRAYFDDTVVPAIEALLGPAEDAEALTVAQALAVHDRIYRIYARELAPRVARARRALVDELATRGETDPEAAAAAMLPPPRTGVGGLLDRAARGDLSRAELLARIGAMAPEWDLSCPTYAEDPAALDRALAARAGRHSAANPDTGGEDAARALTRTAVDIAEEDDLYYARAQYLIRRALLHRAGDLELARPTDIFYVDLATGARGDAARIAGDARQGRARRDQQRRWAMPLEIRNGRPRARPHPRRGVWLGRGSGGRATGPVKHLGPDRGSVAEGEIALVRAFTPAAAVQLADAAAIVCEHGGLLGHAAATARELGIPCLVGCAGAYDHLADGDRVTVDGQGGLLVAAR
jgi:pyruvate,water dikinase